MDRLVDGQSIAKLALVVLTAVGTQAQKQRTVKDVLGQSPEATGSKIWRGASLCVVLDSFTLTKTDITCSISHGVDDQFT